MASSETAGTQQSNVGSQLRGSRFSTTNSTQTIVNTSVNITNIVEATNVSSSANDTLDSAHWPGYGWYPTRGYCTGGSMCDYSDEGKCERSIFGCHWKEVYDGHYSGGHCAGSSMCDYSDRGKCERSIFGCHWEVNYR